MQDQQLVFDNAVEGLFFHGMKHLVTPRLKDELRGAGLDLDKRLAPAYERETWKKVLQISARTAFPTHSLEAAAREMGLLVARGYEETVVGRAIISFARVIGPRRTLSRLTRSLRSANTYVAAEVVELAPSQVEIHCRGLDLSPHFMGGIIEAAMGFCRAKSPVVTVQSSDGDNAVIRVVWKD